jgi:hypothetical protein
LSPSLAHVVELGAGSALLLMAAAVLRFGGQPVHRALAVLLAARAFAYLATDLPASAAGGDLAGAVDIVLPFALAGFVIVYRRRMRMAVGHGWTLPLLAIAPVVLMIVEFGSLVDVGQLVELDLFSIMIGLRVQLAALAALMLALDAFELPAGAHRRSLLLVSAGFALEPLYVGGVIALTGIGADAWYTSFLAGDEGLRAWALAPLLVLDVALVAALARHADPASRSGVRAQLGLQLAVLATVALTLGHTDQGLASTRPVVLGALWALMLPLLAAFALLRHQMFGLELTAKRAVARGTVLGVIAGAFLLGSEYLETLIPLHGAILGFAAAGATSLALHPLQRGAGRLADRLFPGVEDTTEYRASHQREIYREAFEGILIDGTVTPKERRYMDGLRAGLGVAVEDAEAIEREVWALAGRAGQGRGLG